MELFFGKKMLTQKELKEWLSYDPETGIFRWIKVNSNRVYAGKIAGTARKNTPYITIVINRKFYYAHRLAWLYMYGEMPNGMIDHANRVHSDNSISNLRIASYWQNSVNKDVSKISKTGLKGVWVQRNKFSSYIGEKGKRIRLGTFNTAEEAHAAYVKASKEIHGEFSSVQP